MLTQDDLSQFVGTTRYYRHALGRFVYTDGVRHVAEAGAAYWLLDAIALARSQSFASYQPKLLKNEMLQQFQLWKLTVNADQTAQLICERDTDDVVITQDIPFTDFPLSEIRFYLTQGVLMLPSEY